MRIVFPIMLICIATIDAEFTFAIFGDMQADDCNDNAIVSKTVNTMVKCKAAFYVCIGDLISGYNKASCFNSSETCTSPGSDGNVGRILSPLIRKPPAGLLSTLYLVIGNHDDNWGEGWYPDKCGGGICDVVMPVYVNHPRVFDVKGYMRHNLYHGNLCSKYKGASGYGQDYYYSFAYDNTYFIFIYLNQDYYGMFSCNNKPGSYETCADYCADTLRFLDPGRNRNCYNIGQYDWLRSELAKARGCRAIIVFGHVPLLTSSDNHPATAGARNLRTLFEQYHVTAYFNGHDHAYERTFPVKGDAVDPHGVVYITVGPCGAKTDRISGAWYTSASYKQWTRYDNQEQMSGFMQITVKNDGSVEGKHIGIGNVVHDRFTIKR